MYLRIVKEKVDQKEIIQQRIRHQTVHFLKQTLVWVNFSTWWQVSVIITVMQEGSMLKTLLGDTFTQVLTSEKCRCCCWCLLTALHFCIDRKCPEDKMIIFHFFIFTPYPTVKSQISHHTNITLLWQISDLSSWKLSFGCEKFWLRGERKSKWTKKDADLVWTV